MMRDVAGCSESSTCSTIPLLNCSFIVASQSQSVDSAARDGAIIQTIFSC